MSEPAFRFLHEALIRPDQERTSLQRRALIAIDLFSQAWLSWQPDTALLSGVMALEVLLGDQTDRAKKLRVARRASYFVCGWPNHRYSDGQPTCPYLTHPLSSRGEPGPDLQRLIEAVKAGDAPHMYCSQFFDVLGLFDARNDIVHEGRLGLTLRQERQTTWFVSGWLLKPVLTWFAKHPDSELTELDAEIAALPRMDAADSD